MQRSASLAIILLFLVLLVAAVLAGCTQIAITPAHSPVPTIDAKQLGGQLRVVDGETSIWVNNEQSFEAGAKTVRRLVATLAAASVAGEWLDTKRAEDATAATIEQAKIGAETQQQAQEAAAQLDLLKETNRAAEALAP